MIMSAVEMTRDDAVRGKIMGVELNGMILTGRGFITKQRKRILVHEVRKSQVAENHDNDDDDADTAPWLSPSLASETCRRESHADSFSA